jgi:hypothetical protein
MITRRLVALASAFITVTSLVGFPPQAAAEQENGANCTAGGPGSSTCTVSLGSETCTQPSCPTGSYACCKVLSASVSCGCVVSWK